MQLDVYLESPTLLDGALPSWIRAIATHLLARCATETSLDAFAVPCQMLYQLCKIRGFKSVGMGSGVQSDSAIFTGC